MDVLNHLIEVVGNAANAPIMLSIGIAVEFAFRMFKTEKPKSIIYMVADIIKKSGELLTKVGTLLDKVLPQRLK
ncbi:MAG TPA: hypothetical protein PK522_00750 [Nitrosomonas sp.]|nr:hypothetical protein [Nitrosomonas sp.]